MPLYIYIDCKVKKIYDKLIISGKASEEDVKKSWEEIISQVIELTSGLKGKKYLKLQSEELLLNGKLALINICAKIMINVKDYTPDLNAVMNKLCETNLKFENLLEDIQTCIDRTGGLRLTHELKKIELDAMEEKMNKNVIEPKVDYFYSTLITLGDFGKIALNDRITTYDFFERLNRFNKYCDANNN